MIRFFFPFSSSSQPVLLILRPWDCSRHQAAGLFADCGTRPVPCMTPEIEIVF
jgi:hypothetical protein